MGSSVLRALALAGSAACVAAAAAACRGPGGARSPGGRSPPETASQHPRWSIAKILNEKDYDTLLTLTAVGRHDAWAFGQTSSGRAVAVHWNGSAWTGSRIPGAFAPAGIHLCYRACNVWAGGSECTGGPPGTSVTATYVARYNGRTWTTRKWTTAAFCGAALVTTGPKNGWLLGNNRALHFTGKRWHKISLPDLGQVIAATAVSSGDIWTIGGRFNALHLSRSKAFFTHYDGHVWRTVAAAAHQAAEAWLHLPVRRGGGQRAEHLGGGHHLPGSGALVPAALHGQEMAGHTAACQARPAAAGRNRTAAGGVWAIMFQPAERRVRVRALRSRRLEV